MELIKQIIANGVTYSIIKLNGTDRHYINTNHDINGASSKGNWALYLGPIHITHNSFLDKHFLSNFRRTNQLNANLTFATQKEAELTAELMAYKKVFTNGFRQISTECGGVVSAFDMNDEINKVLNKKSD